MSVRIYNACEVKADLYDRIPGDGELDILLGNTAIGDQVFGIWQYSAASSATDDFANGVIRPTLQTGNGRWLRKGYYYTQSDWDETDTESPAYILNKPVVPDAATQSTVTPALNTSAQINASRNCIVNYSVSIAVTSTLLGTNSGTVFLEISSDNTNWTTIGQVSNSIAGVVSTSIPAFVLTGLVPANYYRRLRTAQAGTNGATITSLGGQEILI
jgi:hypothetical protein